ncbi:fluoride efflux transporter CrcB [Streptomyces eurocidicus]|uniref:fluoride efflux transporter CrcB n=1 Tax=Streptomyces eurocidicus TaxID=66423 RepID=UPI000C9B4DD6|nr:fluoride efflux transporter CrcB [Streptomyces eurocidicus]MBF6053435.1 fluoride efflux transporter CrcB [Streptomyces eurocidicus]
MGPSRAVADSGPGVRAPGRAQGRRDGQGPVVCAVSLGGGLGAAARYGAGLLWPTPAGAFPWTTFLVNTVGCALIGVLLTVIAALPAPHRLLRPFLGTGVLGGFTTFSTYAVDVQRLAADGRLPTAVAYVVGTPVAALAAVWAAATATRRLTVRRTG